jgi:hypothetical protein
MPRISIPVVLFFSVCFFATSIGLVYIKSKPIYANQVNSRLSLTANILSSFLNDTFGTIENGIEDWLGPNISYQRSN